MNKFIYDFRKSLSLFLLGIALRIRNHKLCALILWLNIRKFKKIKFKNRNIKKILIFSKSGGNEDLKESFQNNKKNNIVFFWIPRSFLKKIFAHHLEIIVVSLLLSTILKLQRIFLKVGVLMIVLIIFLITNLKRINAILTSILKLNKFHSQKILIS